MVCFPGARRGPSHSLQLQRYWKRKSYHVASCSMGYVKNAYLDWRSPERSPFQLPTLLQLSPCTQTTLAFSFFFENVKLFYCLRPLHMLFPSVWNAHPFSASLVPSAWFLLCFLSPFKCFPCMQGWFVRCYHSVNETQQKYQSCLSRSGRY